MERTEAKAMVALVQAYFPQPALPQSTVELWAGRLQRFDRASVEAVIHAAGGSLARQPSLAELLGAAEREEAAQRSGTGLPEQGAWSEEDTERAREIGVEVLSSWRERHPRPDLKPRQGVPGQKRRPREPETEADIESRRELARAVADAERTDRTEEGLA